MYWPVWLIMLQVRVKVAWARFKRAFAYELAEPVEPVVEEKPKRNKPSKTVTMKKRSTNVKSSGSTKKAKN